MFRQASRSFVSRIVLLSAPVASVAFCFSTENESSTLEETTNILIVGGGTAGIGIAAQLRHKGEKVTIVEPSDVHYYQPMWTLVGGGLKQNTQSAKPMKRVIPSGVKWIQDSASKFDPDNNTVVTKNGKTLKYDFMVLATGLETHFDRIEGLEETIGKNGVISIYDYNYSQNAQETLRQACSGNFIFTQHADSPIKCGGAPQKIMWLTEDSLRRRGIRGQCDVHWFAPQPVMFPVKKYGDVLAQEADDRGVIRHHGMRLIKVDGPNKKAIFQNTSDPNERTTMDFEVLHVIPFMMPPKAVTESLLVDGTGYVDVDKETLQHKKYANVFAAGDSTNLPTSKTMAAIAKQAPVLVHNLLAQKRGEQLTARYDGYTSCPITTARNRLLLAEFKYGGELAETFPFIQGKPRRIFMFFKETAFPFAYFQLYLPGYWYGPRTIFAPSFPTSKPVANPEGKSSPSS